MLRKAAKSHIGEKYAKREKKGFPVPIRDWLREECYMEKVRTYFTGDIAEMFFNTEELMALIDEHISGRKDYWRQIWCIYIFLIWYEVYFGK